MAIHIKDIDELINATKKTKIILLETVKDIVKIAKDGHKMTILIERIDRVLEELDNK